MAHDDNRTRDVHGDSVTYMFPGLCVVHVKTNSNELKVTVSEMANFKKHTQIKLNEFV